MGFGPITFEHSSMASVFGLVLAASLAGVARSTVIIVTSLAGPGAVAATTLEMPTWVSSPQAPAKDLVGDGADTADPEVEKPTWVSSKWVKDLLADGADTADPEVETPT